MIKTALVNLSGTERDDGVLATAATLLGHSAAHLECLHLRFDPIAAAIYTGEVTFGTSAAIAEAIAAAKQDGEARSRRAYASFLSFCRTHDVPRVEAPPGLHHMSAAWREWSGHVVDALVDAARSHDLVVVAGGARDRERLTVDDLGQLVVAAGKPVLLVPERASARPATTVALAWKDAVEPARAVTAALPFLERAQRIVVLGVNEAPEDAAGFAARLDGVAEQLRWHGPVVGAQVVDRGDNSVPDAIVAAARRAEADLLVMGAYGHGRLREMIFGGVTDHVLKGVALPVVMAH